MKAQLPLLLFTLIPSCFGQICNPDAHPQANSGFAYLRAEMKALGWIRIALVESKNIKPPSVVDNAKQFHELVQLHQTAEIVKDDYSCATSILKGYEASSNEYIQESAETLLMAIETTNKLNEQLIGLMDSLYKAQSPQDIDQVEIAKILGNSKALQNEVIQLSMLATKMSTFAIFRMEKVGDDAKPVDFSITLEQRAALRADAQDLAKDNGFTSYIDDCAKIISGGLARQFPAGTNRREF